MLDRVQAEGTFWRFSDPEELYERIREDIEAEVAKRFYEAEHLEELVQFDASAAISGLVPQPKHLLPRIDIADRLLQELATNHVIQVFGPLGIGKTVFLASLAVSNQFLFVSGTRLSDYELASVVTNKLNSVTGGKPRFFADASAAYSALLESWCSCDAFTLIIDDCPDPEFVAALLKNVGGASSSKQIIYSVRDANPLFGHRLVEIPPLSLPEVAEFLVKQGQALPSKERLAFLYKSSGGNPLYLLYYTQSSGETATNTLSEYELAVWRQQSALSRELASYLAIAGQQIAFTDLLILAGTPGGIVEEVTDALRAAQVFIAELTSGYRIRHEHQQAMIVRQLSNNPSKLAYYSSRVANLMRRRGDDVRAYFILRQADAAGAQRLSRSALFDAQRRGDCKSQLVILENILEENLLNSDPYDRLMLLLSKAQALQYAGHGSAEVMAVFLEAEELVTKFGDAVLKLRVREAQTAYSAALTLSPESLALLEKLEQEYATQGDNWSAGRVTTELSVLFTRANKHPESLAAAERGLKIFTEIGDQYGQSISRLNIATALGAIPGREKEALALFESLKEEQEKSGTRRERAWLCNYMVRILRRKRQFSEALEYGREAILIADELGDLHLAATNHINVGNVYRDMREFDSALAEYSAAGELGRKAGDKTVESSASRLSASVYRRQGSNRTALEHAQFAVSLLKSTIASSQLVDALEEVGDCYYEMREWREAAKSFAKAAGASITSDEKCRLAIEALATCVDKELEPFEYVICLDLAYGRKRAGNKPITEQLFESLGDILDSLHIDYAIRLLGLHFRMMFADLPQPVAMFLFRRVLHDLLQRTKGAAAWKLLFSAMPLLVSVANSSLLPLDLAGLTDQVQDRIKGVHFKWSPSGASWVVSLALREPIILTVSCMDDRVDTFVAAALLSLFFKGFERSIAEMLPIPEIPRVELDIVMCSLDSMPPDLRSYVPEFSGPCVVTSPTKFGTNAEAVPTFVICKPEIGQQWRVGTGAGSAVQVLIGQVLIEVVYQLLEGAVDIDILRPKIVEVTRQTVS
jgi:tetratricopeptide (TPR) repeat protein